MALDLAQARRSYYGDNTNNGAAVMDSGTMYYNANGSRTGARIDGRVKRRTMMGGATQGPISTRLNRSEMMEKEAEAEMEKRRQRGVARAQAASGASSGNGVDVPTGSTTKRLGYWKDGRSAGSQVWEPGSPPTTTGSAGQTSTPPAGTTQGTQNGKAVSRAPGYSSGIGLVDMVNGPDLAGARRKRNLKAAQDRNFSRFRAETERNPGVYGFEDVVNRLGTKENNYNGMAKMREEARKRGELAPPKSAKY